MTRRTGQVATRQAIVGAVLVLAVAAGIVAALAPLIPREEPGSLESPAEPAAPDACPDPPAVTPATVTADELIECPRTYDGVRVRYRGEAVRAVLPRGDRAWVHLNDDRYALELGPLPEHGVTAGGNAGIPVSLPLGVARRIAPVGDARHRGALLSVTGVFRRADPAAGGAPTIQARTAEIVQPGRPIPRPFTPARALVAGVLGLAALVASSRARASARR